MSTVEINRLNPRELSVASHPSKGKGGLRTGGELQVNRPQLVSL